MTSEWNGRFAPFEGADSDPEDDFPFRESYSDCSGQTREFEISYRNVGLGYSVCAEEFGKDGLGYVLWAFSETSPYPALGRLRDKIRRALSTRHLEKTDHGYQVFDRSLNGRITGSPDAEGPVVVVDGIPLGFEELGRLISTFEGWEFELKFVDRGE